MKANLKPAVFFDRDGVLNENAGYVHRADQIRWVADAAAAVRTVNQMDYFAFVVTNQSGVGRGYFLEEDVVALHEWMNVELGRWGARIDAFEFCPHYHHSQDQKYRAGQFRQKPRPGMILDLLEKFPIDRCRSILIGDRETDMEAAKSAGIRGIMFTGGSLLAALQPILSEISGPSQLSSRRTLKQAVSKGSISRQPVQS